MNFDTHSVEVRKPLAHQNEPAKMPVLIVRISAIGDTLIAARTQAQLHTRGYAPILVTHKNNASLLSCMPLLQGACLVSDSGLSYLWRKETSKALEQTDESEFIATLKSVFEKNHEHENGNGRSVAVFDLQNTGRSARAMREIENRFTKAGFTFTKRTVAKLSLWRLFLVFLSYLSFKQWPGRQIPNWLQRRLKPVARLQAELLNTLPPRATGNAQEKSPSALNAGSRQPSEFKHGHVVFLVGASLRLKSWPKENYRALQKLILERTQLSVVLCGGSEDARVGEFLAFPSNARVINKIGQTTLAETLSLIQTAAYVVTGDSFASHAADLLGTPGSVIFGATHPLLGFAPQGEHMTVHHAGLSCSPCSRHGQGECRFQNMRCLTLITPEEVFSKIEQIAETGRQADDTARQKSDS